MSQELCSRCPVRSYCEMQYESIADDREVLDETLEGNLPLDPSLETIKKKPLAIARAWIAWENEADESRMTQAERKIIAFQRLSKHFSDDQIAALRFEHRLRPLTKTYQEAAQRIHRTYADIAQFAGILANQYCDLGVEIETDQSGRSILSCNHPSLTPEQRDGTKVVVLKDS